MLLEKMIRMGELYDFYGQLLTPRQQEFMDLYYREDLSLGEIAERFEISRQAVYDNLRRSEKLLEEYEEKLQLLARTTELKGGILQIKLMVEGLHCDPDQQQAILAVIDQLFDR